MKCFHKTFKKKIEWLKEHGFHELIDNEYLTVEFRTRSCNGSYLSVNPDLDGSQWQCIACIDGVWDYDTEAISRHHPNLAIRKSKNCIEKKVQRRFLRLYKNFEEK